MLYLVVKCSELGDQWECDADRTPLCLTENVSQYGLGYEIYRVNPDNTFTLIKEYNKGLEFGMVLYLWDKSDENTEKIPIVLEKWKDKKRDTVTKSLVKNIKKKAGFHAPIKEIMNNIQCCGSHGETIQDRRVVFGEYTDSNYSLGY